MEKKLFFWFVAVTCILASCSKDEATDQSVMTEKARHTNAPVIYLTPGGGDDTQAFIDAFAAAEPGSVIQMGPGVFHVSYIEVYGFEGWLKGAGRDKTFIDPFGLIEINAQLNANFFGTWWKIIGGDVTLSDFAFRTGDGPLISDVDPYYNKTLSCLLMVNNYNADFNLDDRAPMNFNMKNVDFLCGYLDPEVAYLEVPCNVLMAFWAGTDYYWMPEDFVLTSGRYNVINCLVDNAFQGYEGFGLGEEAVFNLDGCRTEECPYGLSFIACYGSKINLLNNTFNNSGWVGAYISDGDYGLLPFIMPVRSCEYVLTGNTFNMPAGSTALLLKDDWGVTHPEKYFPSLVTTKNNKFNLSEGCTGICCLNSVGTTVRNNLFTGTGDIGVFVDGAEVWDMYFGLGLLGTGTASNVLILGNNFTKLSPVVSNVYFGELSSYCTVVGNGKESVTDLGTNNSVIGMKKAQGGQHAGPMIRDNLRMMHHMKR